MARTRIQIQLVLALTLVWVLAIGGCGGGGAPRARMSERRIVIVNNDLAVGIGPARRHPERVVAPGLADGTSGTSSAASNPHVIPGVRVEVGPPVAAVAPTTGSLQVVAVKPTQPATRETPVIAPVTQPANPPIAATQPETQPTVAALTTAPVQPTTVPAVALAASTQPSPAVAATTQVVQTAQVTAAVAAADPATRPTVHVSVTPVVTAAVPAMPTTLQVLLPSTPVHVEVPPINLSVKMPDALRLTVDGNVIAANGQGSNAAVQARAAAPGDSPTGSTAGTAVSNSPGVARTIMLIILAAGCGMAGALLVRRTVAMASMLRPAPKNHSNNGDDSLDDHDDLPSQVATADLPSISTTVLAGSAGALAALLFVGLLAPDVLLKARLLQAELGFVLPLCAVGGFAWQRFGRRVASASPGTLARQVREETDLARHEAQAAGTEAEAARQQAQSAQSEAAVARTRADAARGELARATALIGALVEAQSDTDQGADIEPDPQLADAARSLDDEESDVLRALAKGPDRFRTEGGVSARSAVPIDVVQDVLEELEQQGYAGRIMSPRTGERMWYLTRQGRRLAATRYVV